MLAPTVLNVAIAVRSSGLDDSHLTWSVFAAMVICAVVTALQASRMRRFGAGHVVLAWPAAMFIAIMVATVSAAGLATFASLMIVCSLMQVALAWWLPLLRRIVTPTVSGTVTMLIAVSVLPIAFDTVGDLPADAPAAAGPVIAGATLLASVIVALRARGRWRLVAPFSSILAGCAVAAAFGVLDGDRIADAGWFGIPEVPALGVDLTPGREFWVLLPSFAVLTLVLGLKTISDGVVIQQGSRRRPRAIEFRQIQGMVVAARPQATMVELEFVATTRQDNIEDQLEFLTDEVAVPSVDDLSLRLLRFHASAVRHQKFHGVDIVTVQVEATG